jgi:hypothetical protein
VAYLEFVWDSDNREGLQGNAYGQTVHPIYQTPGDYIVMQRIRDMNGIKPEVRQKVNVTVAQ